LKNRSIHKGLWAKFHIFIVIILLSGCGSGSGGGGDITASSDASLSGLNLDGIALDQTFQADQLSYSASVDFSQDSITLTPVAADAGATIHVNNIEVASGSLSTPIALAVGHNSIDIAVTSGNRSTTQTYTLTISRATASSDASLSELGLTGGTLDQLFQSSQATYSASVGFLQASVTLTPVATDAGASIHINGTEVASGSASSAISLPYGQTIITLVVTAEDGVTTQSYSIDIIREDTNLFAQQAYLKASNADGGYNNWYSYYGDQFGSSVAISGDTLVVGAPGESSSPSRVETVNSNANAGAVYVFTRSGDVWSQQTYLKASNAERDDLFGTSVAISGDTLVVGAPGEDSRSSGGEQNNSGNDAGAAYVFTRSDGVWSQQAFLKARYADEEDQFGASVAISGDTLVVCAPEEDSSATGGEHNNTALSAGAAYVFSRNNGVWSQQAYLKASNAETDDRFGTRVAISEDTIVVGAPEEDSSVSGGEADNSASLAGAAYVFTRSGDTWSQQAYLKANNTEGDESPTLFSASGNYSIAFMPPINGDKFGTSVAISGDTLVVGATGEDSSATGGVTDNSASLAGAVYVFTRNSGVWSQQAYLKASNAESNDEFGTSVAISGDTLVVGATKEDSSATGGEADNSMANAGAAYVFTRSGGAWSQLAQLKASNADAGDNFTASVAISGNTVVVGAPHEDSSANGGEADNSASNAGAAYTW
jgi:hypothetical protein